MTGVHVPLPRVLVGIAASEIRDSVAHAASNVADVVRAVSGAEDVADMLDSATRDFDIAIVDLPTIRIAQRRLRRERSELVVAPATMILVLRLEELREALALLHLCQGIVFWDEDPGKLSNMIGVAIEGYSAAPTSSS